MNRRQKHAESFNVRDAPENSFESDPIEVRVSRTNIDLRNFIPDCFFCGEGDCEEKLHRYEKINCQPKSKKGRTQIGGYYHHGKVE